MIIIYDYGIGNNGSIKNMINRIGLNSEISSEVSLIEQAQYCIIPGVGSYDTCISQFHKQKSSEILLQRISSGLKTLGICVGMQMLFENSEEGKLAGLDLIPGKVKRFGSLDKNFEKKIPHMTWNYISVNNNDITYNGFENNPKFYFVHSFHAVCPDEYVSGYTEYGYEFPASVRKDNIYGVQFHPEKSHTYGMQFFKNFLKDAT